MNLKPEFLNLIKKLKNLKDLNSDEITFNHEITPIVTQLASSPTWLEEKFFHVADDANGFNGHKIYEEPDHTLAIFITAWLPGCGSPPHNHDTWAISAGIVSAETHIFWKRTDDGTQVDRAVIVEQNKFICTPGKVIFLDSEAIHSVWNETNEVAISLQIYGKHPNFTNRIQINPITYETSSFIGKEV